MAQFPSPHTFPAARVLQIRRPCQECHLQKQPPSGVESMKCLGNHSHKFSRSHLLFITEPNHS